MFPLLLSQHQGKSWVFSILDFIWNLLIDTPYLEFPIHTWIFPTLFLSAAFGGPLCKHSEWIEFPTVWQGYCSLWWKSNLYKCFFRRNVCTSNLIQSSIVMVGSVGVTWDHNLSPFWQFDRRIVWGLDILSLCPLQGDNRKCLLCKTCNLCVNTYL